MFQKIWQDGLDIAGIKIKILGRCCNEKDDARETLKRARIDIDKYRIDTQTQIDQIGIVARGLSRTATASSDVRYSTDKINEDLEKLDRMIDSINIYLKRIEQTTRPKNILISVPYRSLEETKASLTSDLEDEKIKLYLAKLMINGAKFFKSGGFKNGYIFYYKSLMLLQKMIFNAKNVSKNNVEEIICAVTRENVLVPKTLKELLCSWNAIEDVNNDLKDFLTKKSGCENDIQKFWFTKALANIVNGMALTIRYSAEKSQPSNEVLNLYQVLIKFYTLANELISDNPILQTNYAIFLDRAQLTEGRYCHHLLSFPENFSGYRDCYLFISSEKKFYYINSNSCVSEVILNDLDLIGEKLPTKEHPITYFESNEIYTFITLNSECSHNPFESNIWARKSFESGAQDMIVRNFYAVTLMNRAFSENGRKKDLLNSALTIFDSILVDHPSTPAVLNNRGFLYYLIAKESQGNKKKQFLEKSLNDLNKAEILSPNDEMLLFHRATTKFELGDIEGAKLDLETCCRVYPHMFKEPLLLYLYAVALYKKGDKDTANTLLEKAKNIVEDYQNKFGKKVIIRLDEYFEAADVFIERVDEAKLKLSQSISWNWLLFGLYSSPEKLYCANKPELNETLRHKV